MVFVDECGAQIINQREESFIEKFLALAVAITDRHRWRRNRRQLGCLSLGSEWMERCPCSGAKYVSYTFNL